MKKIIFISSLPFLSVFVFLFGFLFAMIVVLAGKLLFS